MTIQQTEKIAEVIADQVRTAGEDRVLLSALWSLALGIADQLSDFVQGFDQDLFISLCDIQDTAEDDGQMEFDFVSELAYRQEQYKSMREISDLEII